MTSTWPASPAAFRRSLSDRIKRGAARTGIPHQQLQRRFLTQRFLARVFADPGPWVLKGGTGLLIRLPGARHSKDIDLLNTDLNVDAAVQELQNLAGQHAADPLIFELRDAVAMSGGVAGVTIPVTAYLGGELDSFSIDLSTELHMVGHLDRTHPTPVVDVPGLPALPEFVLYPLEDQVADKVCAMYERYGDQQRPSSRYRDLVDLLLIITNLALDARKTADALAAESRRRGLTLPGQLIEPGPDWSRGYQKIARASTLDRQLHNLPNGLQHASTCLNPLLAGHLVSGTWDHVDALWR